MVTFVERKKWKAWRPGKIGPNRVQLKPARRTIVLMILFGLLCMGTSIALVYLFRSPFSWPINVIHALLWLIGVWAPMSLLYQGVEFVKEPERGTVYVIMHSAIISSQHRFPLRHTRLSLQRTGAYRRTLHTNATGVPKLLGYRWILRLFGPTKFDLQIGYSSGKEYPRTPPENVQKLFTALQELFEF